MRGSGLKTNLDGAIIAADDNVLTGGGGVRAQRGDARAAHAPRILHDHAARAGVSTDECNLGRE